MRFRPQMVVLVVVLVLLVGFVAECSAKSNGRGRGNGRSNRGNGRSNRGGNNNDNDDDDRNRRYRNQDGDDDENESAPQPAIDIAALESSVFTTPVSKTVIATSTVLSKSLVTSIESSQSPTSNPNPPTIENRKPSTTFVTSTTSVITNTNTTIADPMSGIVGPKPTATSPFDLDGEDDDPSIDTLRHRAADLCKNEQNMLSRCTACGMNNTEFFDAYSKAWNTALNGDYCKNQMKDHSLCDPGLSYDQMQEKFDSGCLKKVFVTWRPREGWDEDDYEDEDKCEEKDDELEDWMELCYQAGGQVLPPPTETPTPTSVATSKPKGIKFPQAAQAESGTTGRLSRGFFVTVGTCICTAIVVIIMT